MSVLFIPASVAARPSRSGALLDHVASRLILAGVEIRRASPALVPMDGAWSARDRDLAAAALRRAVDASEAIVVATSLDAMSTSDGPLLDLLVDRSRAGVPVLPLVVGHGSDPGRDGDRRLAALASSGGARRLPPAVFACGDDVTWAGDAEAFARFGPALTRRLNAAVDVFLDLLDRPPAFAAPMDRATRGAGVAEHRGA